MPERTIAVGGMNCGGCEQRVEEALVEVEHVTEARADRDEGTATVTYDEGADPNLETVIDDLGFDFLGWR